MSRTPGGLRSQPAAPLAELASRRPEWETWIALLESAWRAADESWISVLGEREPIETPAEPVPLLHGRSLGIDPQRVQRLIGGLASIAGQELDTRDPLLRYRPSETEALELVSAAICQSNEIFEARALERGLDSGALASVVHLAALPLLQWCGRELKGQIPDYWPAGYCPVCAAWPTLVERRGLDRSRRLRCGRCAADWEVQWLYCVYCGEREHTKLGSLATDESGDGPKLETCASCHGYLKSIATLQGFTPLELLTQDLETVELDLVALDRDYRRPSISGFRLSVQLLSHAAG